MTEQKNYERYMTVLDLCNALSVTPETIYRWIKCNALPAHRVGKRWMFKQIEVDDWVTSEKAADEE